MVADLTAASPAAPPLLARDPGGRRRRPAAWVAMYHSVSNCPDDPYDITVTPGRLERQFAWLADRGLRGVSVRELLDARALGLGSGLVGLTFDDGYADFVTTAVPVLHRWGFTATVFVLPGLLAGDNRWDRSGPRKALLDEDGIRCAVDAGMEIGSHGLTHVDLTRATAGKLHAEVAGSRDRLARITGEDVEGFCYPYGRLDARAVDAVRLAGYRYGCAIAPGPAGCGDLGLPRIHVGETDSRLRLELKSRLARIYGRALESR